MFSGKSLVGWVRVARIVLGVGTLSGALAIFGSTPIGWFAGLYAAFAINFGPCPACAVAGIMGRRRKS